MSLANIGQEPAKTIEQLERANADLRQDSWNLTGRLIMARERIEELEFQNKIMKEELRRLQRITHIETQEAGK